MIHFKILTKNEKYFALAFVLGFILKYNYLCLVIYQVPLIVPLIFKDIIIFLFLYFYILPLLKNKAVRYTLFFFLLFYTLFFLANVWYNRYFGNYLSLSDILMGQGVRPFSVLVKQLIKSYDFIFIFDLIIAGLYISKEKESYKRKYIFSDLAHFKIKHPIFIILFLLALQILGTNYFLGKEKPTTLFNQSTSSFVNVYGILPLYFFEFLSFYQSENINEQVSPPPADDENLIDEEVIKDKIKISNIIVIQVESLDKNIIGHEHKGIPITPFLNKLKKRSVYFDNFYAQHINGSFDAEFSFLTSIYPINKNYGFKVNDLSRFTSLVKILKKKGYTSAAFHGNDKEFFHRHKAFSELGFDRFYSREDYSFSDAVMQTGKSTFGINDYDFFIQSFEYLTKIDEPFFSFFITVTSHTPYDFYPQDHAINRFHDVKNPLIRDYFRSISFVDKSLKMFFELIKDSNMDENTMFIIYSDHESGVEGHSYSSKRSFQLDKMVKAPENVPLFILHPDLEPKTVDKEGTTTDLAPTILGLLGEKEKPEEFLGHSLLQDETQPILFLHEIPQVLYQGQLFACMPGGIEKIGYAQDIGDRDIQLQNNNEIQDIISYMQNMILRRRIQSE